MKFHSSFDLSNFFNKKLLCENSPFLCIRTQTFNIEKYSYCPLLSLSSLVMYSRRLTSKYCAKFHPIILS